MHKIFLYANKDFIIWRIVEILILDEGGCYETSYPYDEMIDVKELPNNKVCVVYDYKQSVIY